MINISKPLIGQEEMKAVKKVLKSGIIASGPKVKEFEDKFGRYLGVKNAVAVANGTCAIHAALYAAGVKKGDRVLVPSFTFIASANAVLHAGAEPVFADSKPDTYNLDPASVENELKKDLKGRIKALIAVHLYGRVCEMDAIKKIARKYGVRVIEDAAQAHGAKYNNAYAGTLGDAAAFSMYATKNMTSSEGGMVVTNSASMAQVIRSFINHGQEEQYYHTRIGYNYRTTDIEAAIGICQLAKLDKFNVKRRKNAAALKKKLEKYDFIILPSEEREDYHIYHQFTIRVKSGLRDSLAVFLRENGVGVKVFYPVPVHKQPFYRNLLKKKIKLPGAEKLAKEVISIPVHPGLRAVDIAKIISVFRKFAGRI